MGDPDGSDDSATPATGPGMFAWVLPSFWRRVASVSGRHCLERSFFHSVLTGADVKVLTAATVHSQVVGPRRSRSRDRPKQLCSVPTHKVHPTIPHAPPLATRHPRPSLGHPGEQFRTRPPLFTGTGCNTKSAMTASGPLITVFS